MKAILKISSYIFIAQILKVFNFQKKLKNKKITVIVENDNRARTDGFAKVSLDKDYPSGEILNMVVTGKDKFGLIGKVVA